MPTNSGCLGSGMSLVGQHIYRFREEIRLTMKMRAKPDLKSQLKKMNDLRSIEHTPQDPHVIREKRSSFYRHILRLPLLLYHIHLWRSI